MARIVESPGVFRARLLFSLILSALLILLAHGCAELAGYIGSGVSWTALYFRAVFTLWVAIVLLTPALCAYIFLRPRAQWLLARLLDGQLPGLPLQSLLVITRRERDDWEDKTGDRIGPGGLVDP